jgi:hypothetical protein
MVLHIYNNASKWTISPKRSGVMLPTRVLGRRASAGLLVNDRRRGPMDPTNIHIFLAEKT